MGKSPISIRKSNESFIYSIGPDVCLTPMGSSMVPVAYNSLVFLKNSTNTLRNVSDNRVKDFNLNSRGQGIIGHEPGTGKGIKVPGYKKFAAIIQSTSSVYTNGLPIVRDGDLAMINSPIEEGYTEQVEWINKRLESM